MAQSDKRDRNGRPARGRERAQLAPESAAAAAGVTQPLCALPAREGWRVLMRQRWLLLAGLLLGLVVGVAVALTRPRVYGAAALLRVDERRSALPTVDARAPLATSNQIGTEMEVLRSNSLLASAVDSLRLRLVVLRPRGMARGGLLTAFELAADAPPARYRLARDDRGGFRVDTAGSAAILARIAPGERARLPGLNLLLSPAAFRQSQIILEVRSRGEAVDRLLEKLAITRPNRDAGIIRVQYRDADPRLARDVPNVLVTRFLQTRQRAQQTETRSTIAFLRRQLGIIRAQLASAEEELRSFREAQGVVNLQVEGDTRIRQLADMQAQRASLEAERSSLAQLFRQVRAGAAANRRNGPSPYRRLIAFPSLLRNQAAAELLRSLATVENDRAALVTRRKPTDPDVVVLTNRIHELETQLEAIVTTYLQGLTRQVASLDATLSRFRQRLELMPAQDLQLARLTRRAQTLQDIDGVLERRLAEAEVAQAAEDASERLVDPATLPYRPLRSMRVLIVVFSLLCGLLLATGIAFLREYTDQSVRSRADVHFATGSGVLGLVPRADDLQPRRLLAARAWERVIPARAAGAAATRTNLAPHSTSAPPTPRRALLTSLGTQAAVVLADAYERVYLRILQARPDVSTRVFLITSPLPGDGKTTTAGNFALSLAQRGLRVLLIDADLRRGAVDTLFGVPREPGLADVVQGRAAWAEALRALDVAEGKRLHYVTAGRLSGNTTSLLLAAPEMALLVQSVKQEYDAVIVDSSPVNLMHGSVITASYADAVILVARAGVTPFPALGFAAEEFRAAGIPVLGTVLNDIHFPRDAGYDSAYRWYGYSKAYQGVG